MKRIFFPLLLAASLAGCASTGARNDDAQASDDPAANTDPTYPGRGPRVGVGIGIGSWGGRSGGGVGVGLGF